MAGSIEQVDKFTISSATSSVIIGGGSGGSSGENVSINTNNVYLLTYHSLFMTDDGRVPQIRFTKSSDNSADTTSNYAHAFANMYTNQATYFNGEVGQAYFSNNSTGTTAVEGQAGMMYLYNFANSSEYSFMIKEAINITETPEVSGMFKGGALQVTQSCNGVQFFANAGTIKSGTFILYKINN